MEVISNFEFKYLNSVLYYSFVVFGGTLDVHANLGNEEKALHNQFNADIP